MLLEFVISDREHTIYGLINALLGRRSTVFCTLRLYRSSIRAVGESQFHYIFIKIHLRLNRE